MDEKLCLQWNDFQDNIRNAFGNLRDTNDFIDVTLACEDGRQIGGSCCFKSILSKDSQREQTQSSDDLHERVEVQ